MNDYDKSAEEFAEAVLLSAQSNWHKVNTYVNSISQEVKDSIFNDNIAWNWIENNVSENDTPKENVLISRKDIIKGIPKKYITRFEVMYEQEYFKKIEDYDEDIEDICCDYSSVDFFKVWYIKGGSLFGKWLEKRRNIFKLWEFDNGAFRAGILYDWEKESVWEFDNYWQLHGFWISSTNRRVLVFYKNKELVDIWEIFSIEEQLIIRKYINSLEFWEKFEEMERMIQIQKKKNEIMLQKDFSVELDFFEDTCISKDERKIIEWYAINQEIRNIILPIFFFSDDYGTIEVEIQQLLKKQKIGDFIFPEDFHLRDYTYQIEREYVREKVSNMNIEMLYEKNPEKFLKIYQYINRIKEPTCTNWDSFHEKYPHINIYEATSFTWLITGSWHFHRFENQSYDDNHPWHLFEKVLFYNLIKKMPKTHAKVYRGIWISGSVREEFLRNENNSLWRQIQNFTRYEKVAQSFAGKGLIIEIESDEIKDLSWELWEREWHCFFENGTQFEFIHIDDSVEPYRVVARVKK